MRKMISCAGQEGPRRHTPRSRAEGWCVRDSPGGVSRTVDVQLRVTDNLLDLAVGLEVVEGFPGERTVDLETIDEGGDGDQAVGLNILLEAVVLLLVEDNSVLGLVLDCAACQWRFLQMTVGLGCARVGEGVGERRAPERGGFRSEARRLGGYLCLCVCCVCALRSHVPLPLDHFFFCFLPPVAEGAWELSVTTGPLRGGCGVHYHVPFCRCGVVLRRVLAGQTKWCLADVCGALGD
jgi:hypothetical protein